MAAIRDGSNKTRTPVQGMEKLLLESVFEGKLELVKKILDKGASVNTADEVREQRQSKSNCLILTVPSFLTFIAPFSHLEERIELIIHYFQEGTTLLIVACDEGHCEVASELVRRSAEVNKMNKQGFSALHAATIKRNCKIMELLLVAGADPELRTKVTLFLLLDPF